MKFLEGFMQKGLQELFEKRLTRKEFLQYLLGALITIFGLQSLLGNLTRLHTPPQAADPKSNNGFGTRKFGA
jgi:hypothetical protein